MPRRFVRESKFRHVFGDPYKRTNCYDNINITKNMWDGGNYSAVNSKFMAVVLENGGGGIILVLPIDKVGRIDPASPKISGHSGKVLDIQFNPFNTNVLASAGENSKIMVWKIPEGGLTEDIKDSNIDLIGHQKKVGIIRWHPTANNILASAGFDFQVIIWDVEKGCPANVISVHTDVINSLDWNFDGSLLATSCKDKKGRIIDPRDEKEESQIVHEFEAHKGSKPFRIHFVDDKRLVTIGVDSSSEREIKLWNTTDLEQPIGVHQLDQGSGNILSMFDSTLNILYVAVKGDCNIRYFEISKESPYVHFLNQYGTGDPQRGFGVLPKRALNVNKCEVYRLYKLNSKGFVEPISMVVPRKSDSFQPDIYPNVPGDSPALTADQWIDGKNADPVLISLKDGFKATEKDFNVIVPTTEDNIFAVGLKTAPAKEKDLKKSFYAQQDELRELRELLKGKELKIRQLEYENEKLKKKTGNVEESDTNNKIEETSGREVSSMIAEDTDCSDASSEGQENVIPVQIHSKNNAEEIPTC